MQGYPKLRHPDRNEAERRNLFCCLGHTRRSLDYAARWAASLGMTKVFGDMR
jgi:hypothetical protein